MIYSKTQAAWFLSCQRLFAQHPRIYFWTFTFTEVLNDWVYPVRWQGFVRELIWNVYAGRCSGLRVIEIHPNGHGLHYHALLNRYMWIRLALRIGKRYGIGRITVEKADENAPKYLAKYLDKQKWPTATRIARWHSVGNFNAIRKNDIEVLSPLNNAIREAQDAAGKKRLSYEDYARIKLQHYDLICEPKHALQTPLHTGRPLAEPESFPSELDEFWPALDGQGLITSSILDDSPDYISSASGLFEPTSCINGVKSTRNTRLYQLTEPRSFTA